MTPYAEGFLVVRKPHTTNYRGLYRTPEFDQEAFNAGFDDPYLTAEFLDDFGLVNPRERADEVLDRFSELLPVEDLEIVHARELHPEKPGGGANDRELLGYDIATYSPFWSIIADGPIALLAEWAPRLNDNGLFSSPETAESYLQAFRETRPEDANVALRIWGVSSA